ncbi:MAG: aldehyde dehydrogenase family protein [Chromatiales bacterium]|nr:MAG: aldehyde dehydrogenase family protein [Chromatiales bacterium]
MARAIPVRNPRTGEDDHTIQAADPPELAEVAAAMRAAQPAWQALGTEGRTQVLDAWAKALLAEPDPVLDALAADTGRYLIAMVELHGIPGMVARWHDAAPRLLDEGGERDSATPGVGVRDNWVPLELVGVISPWNFPLLLSMIDSIPALAAGCAVLVKPSEVTPRFAEPLMDAIARFPELAAVFRYVPGDGITGAALIEQVDAIAFTGSVKTGRLVAEGCAKRFIPAFLELGGKDPCIVLPSADPAKAAGIVLRASVQATGQACQSLERVYVHDSIYDAFIAELSERAGALEFNYPDIHQGHIGPLIFSRQAETIEAHLADARAKGAEILCGGEIENHGGGLWIRPTVVVNVDHSMQLMRDETFGPVIPVMRYSDEDEAIRLANDTEYGLSAAVLGDAVEADRIARQLNAGAVSINDGGMTTDVHDAAHDAFGYSGLGVSRMGPSGLLRYLRRKALLIRRGEPRDMSSLDERLAVSR